MDFLTLDPLLIQALQEDLGRGDITTDAILKGRPVRASARVLAKEDLVLCGWPVFQRLFELLGDVEAEPCCVDGDLVRPGLIGVLRGDAALLLKGERVALNFLQRLSGVATQTRKFVDMVKHTKVRILDTRKTTPMWRMLQKYAVRMGGGGNHRMGLDDAILIKENHVTMAGGMREAVEACRLQLRHIHRIEVEVENLYQLQEALDIGVGVIMLDDMSVEDVRRAVAVAKGRCLLEVSGGVNEANVVEYAETGVDYISLGLLTHTYRSPDISILMETYGHA